MALPTIFREYIGSKPFPQTFDDFPDIINPGIQEFHFIVAFAAEVYHGIGRGDEGRKGTGDFYRNWLVPLIDGEMIRKLKNKYDNVKVLISIGGRGSKYPFNPAENEERWFRNARDSLTTIINDLKAQGGVIDGIDINYDTINSSVDVFANCIGKLIYTLKSDQLIKVVSIAPSDYAQHSAQAHYRRLYSVHNINIDWVNYQFYTGQSITSAAEFENRYGQLAREVYTGGKLLAGFSTDPTDAGKVPREVFIKACRDLINGRVLPGIFIWNANDSASNASPFQMEGHAQNLETRN